MRLLWLDSLAETMQYVRSNFRLADSIGQIASPLLIVHGARDHLTSLEEMEDMARGAGEHAALWVYEDGTHALWNKLEIVAPRTADWVAEHL